MGNLNAVSNRFSFGQLIPGLPIDYHCPLKLSERQTSEENRIAFNDTQKLRQEFSLHLQDGNEGLLHTS